jgi:hypothetical protein
MPLLLLPALALPLLGAGGPALAGRRAVALDHGWRFNLEPARPRPPACPPAAFPIDRPGGVGRG